MKKILFAIAIVMTMSFCANAQSDGWFQASDDAFRTAGETLETNMPGAHGMDIEYDAPLGNGLLILAALGAGYALRKRNK